MDVQPEPDGLRPTAGEDPTVSALTGNVRFLSEVFRQTVLTERAKGESRDTFDKGV
jgi:hypothetical protein